MTERQAKAAVEVLLPFFKGEIPFVKVGTTSPVVSYNNGFCPIGLMMKEGLPYYEKGLTWADNEEDFSGLICVHEGYTFLKEEYQDLPRNLYDHISNLYDWASLWTYEEGFVRRKELFTKIALTMGWMQRYFVEEGYEYYTQLWEQVVNYIFNGGISGKTTQK